MSTDIKKTLAKCPHGIDVGKQCPFCITVCRIVKGNTQINFIDVLDIKKRNTVTFAQYFKIK